MTKIKPVAPETTLARAILFQERLNVLAKRMQGLRLNPRVDWIKPDSGPIFKNQDDRIDYERAERSEERLARSVRIRNYTAVQENGVWSVTPSR